MADLLILDRFCGREEYPVTAATWNIYRAEMMNQDEATELCVVVRAAQGTKLHEDTEVIEGEPHWEINFVEPDLSRAALVPGAVFEVPVGYDESKDGHLTVFYHCEHENSERNRIEILEVDGDRMRMRLTGESFDVAQSSRPGMKISVECWFELSESTRRSIS